MPNNIKTFAELNEGDMFLWNGRHYDKLNENEAVEHDSVEWIPITFAPDVRVEEA